MTDDSPRRALRHAIQRARNERIASSRDGQLPVLIRLAQPALDALLTDSNPAEQFTIDWEGREFMRIPLLVDPALSDDQASLEWPV